MFDYLSRAWAGYSAAGQGRVVQAQFIDNHEGSMEVIGAMDPHLESFLSWMSTEGHLANTVVMIVAGPPRAMLSDMSVCEPLWGP